MKTPRTLAASCACLLAAFAVFVLTFAASAQDLPAGNDQGPMTTVQFTPPALPPTALIITVLVPLVIAGLKRLFPQLPAGALPVIAPVLGGLLEYALSHLAGVNAGGTVAGAVAGSAGVGVREIVKHHVGKAPPAAALLVFGLLLFTPGCAGFSNRQQDRSVVIHPDGTREERDILSRQRANTLLDSKSALAQLKAQQTDKTQSIGIGSLNQESAAPNLSQMFGLELLLKLAGTPEGKVALRALGIPLP